jgi:hypothetical protein
MQLLTSANCVRPVRQRVGKAGRTKELERQLHRRDKALTETAAMLVMSKVFRDGEAA